MFLEILQNSQKRLQHRSLPIKVLSEISEHLEKKTRQKVMNELTILFTNKTIRRCCDDRLVLVNVFLHLTTARIYQSKYANVKTLQFEFFIFQLFAKPVRHGPKCNTPKKFIWEHRVIFAIFANSEKESQIQKVLQKQPVKKMSLCYQIYSLEFK